MDERLLKDLLQRRNEEDWYDFKAKLRLFQANGKVSENPRDELIKDILGMANGNGHIIRKTKYLIIGASDNEFSESGMRRLYDVDYPVPVKGDINKWVNNACDPAVTGIECKTISIEGVNLFVIIIPPTFELHETKRELITPRRFNEHTVFMRQDDTTVPASVREGVTIQQLKHLHRQVIENPSSVWMGGIVGGIIAFIFWGAGISSTKTETDFSNPIITILVVLLGIFFGAAIGSTNQVWRAVRYDLPFMTLRQKIILVLSLAVILPGSYFLLIWLSSR